MALIHQIVTSIQIGCRNSDAVSAVHGAVRLARLKSDLPSLAYFLIELSGTGTVRRDLESEFPEVDSVALKNIVSRALDRYFQAHRILPIEAQSLGMEEGSILSFPVNQIDEQIAETKRLLSDAQFRSNLPQSDVAFWVNNMIGFQLKVAALQRTKANILNACFNYSSQIEASADASEQFTGELIKVTDGISAFLREHCPPAQSQFEIVLNDLSANSLERWSHLFTSMRRLINTLADGLSPPQSLSGLEKDKPLNRLLFHFENSLEVSGMSMDKQFLEGILRSIYDRANKGVHTNVSQLEVQQSVMLLLVYLNALKNVTPYREASFRSKS